jgi:DNA-binding XRE family transcriptional regulator
VSSGTGRRPNWWICWIFPGSGQFPRTGKYDPSLPLAFKVAALFKFKIEDVFMPEEKGQYTCKPIWLLFYLNSEKLTPRYFQKESR